MGVPDLLPLLPSLLPYLSPNYTPRVTKVLVCIDHRQPYHSPLNIFAGQLSLYSLQTRKYTKNHEFTATPSGPYLRPLKNCPIFHTHPTTCAATDQISQLRMATRKSTAMASTDP